MAATRTITNAFAVRTLPDIFYEDPEPVEDGMRQAPHVHRLVHLLMQRYEDRPDVFVSGDGFVNYNRRNGNDRVAPDCFIAFDVDVQAIYANLPNFWVWEIGKAPDFALEVASPSTAANDVGPKRALYERLGVREYWRFDPTGGDLYGQALAGDRLVNGVYQPCETVTTADGVVRGHCALLGVDFSWDGASFDALDPETGKTIDKLAAEREARLEAEAEIARLREQLRRQS